MTDLLIGVTGLLLLVAAYVGLHRTRDPLSPLTVFTPMLVYMYVYKPLSVRSTPEFANLFARPAELQLAHVVTLLSVAAFCLGCLRARRPRGGVDRRFVLLRHGMSRSARLQLQQLAVLLGVVACGSFCFMVYYSGGWVRVFSQAKPVLLSPSGYIGELPMLCYPALLLLAVSLQGLRVGAGRVLLFLLVASPQLIMATWGGRRGPMFLITCTLAGCWCIVHSRRPQTRTIVAGLAALGLLLLVQGGNRGDLFKPWTGHANLTAVADSLAPEQVTAGDEYVCGSAMILISEQTGRHYWGVRYFVTLFIRPIPAALWPAKYHDFGLGWMETDPGRGGFSTSEWLEHVGFEPAGGNAGGFIADSFLEFSWGCILVSFLVGWFYSWSWRRWVTRGGLAAIMYMELLILSVYLPSQSMGAWGYRLILLGVPTLFIWMRIVEPGLRRRFVVDPALAPQTQAFAGHAERHREPLAASVDGETQ